MNRPALSEEEKRQVALAMQAEYQKRYGTPGVTRAGGDSPTGVIQPHGTVKTAAGKRKNGTGDGRDGQKIASSSAAPRAPQAGAADPEIPESMRTKPNKKENEFMLNLMILRNTLRTNAPACRERARLTGKWVWRDMRLMLTLVDRIQRKMLRTMPASRDEYYSAYARHGHYELHIDSPVRTPRQLLVTDKHLAAMAEAVLKSECLMCLREGDEIGKCELRDALLESAAPTAVESDSYIRRCEYRRAAEQLIEGKDVTI